MKKTIDWQRYMRTALFITAFLLLWHGSRLAALNLATASGTTYGAAGLCMLFAFLPAFKRIKGPGIEAEMVERKLERAEEIIQHLRRITLVLAEMNFSMLARFGRYGGGNLPRRQRYDLMNSIESELSELEAAPPEIEAAKCDLHRYNAFDMAAPLVKSLRQRLHDRRDENESMVRTKGLKHGMPGWQDYIEARKIHHAQCTAAGQFVHPPEDYRDYPVLLLNFIQTCPALMDSDRQDLLSEHTEVIQDMEHYAQHGEFRRLDAWFAKDEET